MPALEQVMTMYEMGPLRALSLVDMCVCVRARLRNAKLEVKKHGSHKKECKWALICFWTKPLTQKLFKGKRSYKCLRYGYPFFPLLRLKYQFYNKYGFLKFILLSVPVKMSYDPTM